MIWVHHWNLCINAFAFDVKQLLCSLKTLQSFTNALACVGARVTGSKRRHTETNSSKEGERELVREGGVTIFFALLTVYGTPCVTMFTLEMLMGRYPYPPWYEYSSLGLGCCKTDENHSLCETKYRIHFLKLYLKLYIQMVPLNPPIDR